MTDIIELANKHGEILDKTSGYNFTQRTHNKYILFTTAQLEAFAAELVPKRLTIDEIYNTFIEPAGNDYLTFADAIQDKLLGVK